MAKSFFFAFFLRGKRKRKRTGVDLADCIGGTISSREIENFFAAVGHETTIKDTDFWYQRAEIGTKNETGVIKLEKVLD